MTPAPQDFPTAETVDTVPARYAEVELLELDETVPPRPEEEIADVLRSAPDLRGRGAVGS